MKFPVIAMIVPSFLQDNSQIIIIDANISFPNSCFFRVNVEFSFHASCLLLISLNNIRFVFENTSKIIKSFMGYWKIQVSVRY